MEGGDKDMEANVIMQLDDESMRKKINQIMEDRNQHDFKIGNKPRIFTCLRNFYSYKTC